MALDGGERIAAAALIGADGVSSNVRKRIVGDGDPLPAGAIIFRATIPAAADAEGLCSKPYPTFWGGPDWHMIYYPISDWSTFNLGCTVLTGQDTLSEAEDFAPDVVLPYFAEPLRDSGSRASHPEKLPPLRHRAPRAGRQLDHGRGDAARRRRASDGAVHRAGRGDGAGGCDLPRQRRATNATATSRARSSAIRTSASCAPRGCRFPR